MQLGIDWSLSTPLKTATLGAAVTGAALAAAIAAELQCARRNISCGGVQCRSVFKKAAKQQQYGMGL